MPAPILFPCGQKGQPPCPPEPAIELTDTALFTAEQMRAHGAACYLKGRQDEAAGVPLAGESGQ
jgi:hypothetical protein